MNQFVEGWPFWPPQTGGGGGSADGAVPSAEMLYAKLDRKHFHAASISATPHVLLYRAAGDAESDAAARPVASYLHPFIGKELT